MAKVDWSGFGRDFPSVSDLVPDGLKSVVRELARRIDTSKHYKFTLSGDGDSAKIDLHPSGEPDLAHEPAPAPPATDAELARQAADAATAATAAEPAAPAAARRDLTDTQVNENERRAALAKEMADRANPPKPAKKKRLAKATRSSSKTTTKHPTTTTTTTTATRATATMSTAATPEKAANK